MPDDPEIPRKLLEEWPAGQVWFRDLIPRERPWGDEDYLDEVPESARDSYGVKFAATTRIDGETYREGNIALVDTREGLERLLAQSERISGIVVPWWDRVVPPALLRPFHESIEAGPYRQGLARQFWKSLAISAVIIGFGYLRPELLMMALIAAAFFGLFPLVEVALAWFQPVDRLQPAELNRRIVNSEFFQRWLLSRPTGVMKLAVGILVLVFLGQMAVDWGTPFGRLTPSILEAALVPEAVFQGGEWWRCITTGLMHGSILHILFNGMALYSLGRVILALVNPSLLAMVFLVTVIAGSFASLYLPPENPSVGASGGILGCLGFLLVVTYRFKGVFPGYLRLRLIQSTIVIAIFGLIGSAFIDNAAHAGGFLGGVVLGLAYWPWMTLSPGATPFPVRALGWLSMSILVAGVIKVGLELWRIGFS